MVVGAQTYFVLQHAENDGTSTTSSSGSVLVVGAKTYFFGAPSYCAVCSACGWPFGTESLKEEGPGEEVEEKFEHDETDREGEGKKNEHDETSTVEI